jgi:hypothetical protein
MASAERKAADQKIKEENFHKSLAAGEQQAETDAFQCSRCKQVRSLRCVPALDFQFSHPNPSENVVTDKRRPEALMNP